VLRLPAVAQKELRDVCLGGQTWPFRNSSTSGSAGRPFALAKLGPPGDSLFRQEGAPFG
jgi:hypothetical protein